MPQEPDPHWHRTAKIGDEFRGTHIGVIHFCKDEYLIYSSVEDPENVTYYYSNDKLGDHLDKISVSLTKLKTGLNGHPDRKKYISSVAMVYSLAFQNKIKRAEQAVQAILDHLNGNTGAATIPAAGQTASVKKPKHLLIALFGFLLVAALLITYFNWYRKIDGAGNLFFYLILISFGVGVAALLYGLTSYFGSLNGKIMGVDYKFTGPVVAVILTVAGFFYLPQNPGPGPETTFTVRVFNNNNPVNGGEVKLYIPGHNVAPLPISDGQAIFSDLPKQKLKQRIEIRASCPGYLSILVDTIIDGLTSIKLNMVAAGQIKIEGKITGPDGEYVPNAIIRVKSGKDTAESLSNGNYFLKVNNVTSGDPIILIIKAAGYIEMTDDVKPTSESNTKNITLKRLIKSGPPDITVPVKKPLLGSNYQGGIVFHLEPDGKHGLIAAEIDQGINAAWWIRSSDITRNAYSLEDGYANSVNIVDDQGKSGAYAALLCRNYQAGGYTDWFLPSIDQLEMLYNKRNLVKNLKPQRYWSSTANGDNAWYLDFSNKTKTVDYPFTRYRVRAIREF